MYYTQNTNIYQVEQIGEYTDEVFVKKNEPKLKRKWIKYKVIRQLGADKSNRSAFHTLKTEISKVVFEDLEEAKKSIISKLENSINLIKNYA